MIEQNITVLPGLDAGCIKKAIQLSWFVIEIKQTSIASFSDHFLAESIFRLTKGHLFISGK